MPVMKRSIAFWFFCLVALSLPAPGFAQFDTATVVGTVRDKSSAVVPGATVTLTNLDTGIAVTRVSDENGSYEFITVRVGRYKVTAELQGFSTALADNIQVTVGARQRVDLQLTPGNLTETVEVVGAATRLETDSSQRGQVITSEQAVQLPLNGREYSALALLSPGVRMSALNTGSSQTVREGSFNINGLRSTFNNFLLDGIDNNAYGTSNQGFSNQVMQPSPDAVAEFKVVTNNMSAEYGRSAGGVINVAYRSGTNRFSGAGWEFFRDTDLNATGFFKPVTGEKPPMSRDQFGFTLGGPILRNKAFFFSDYEGFRQTRENVAFQTIPNMTQRQGILSVDVRNPLTGATYAAGTPIPMTAFARKVLTELPEPTSSAAANNYSILQEFTNTTDKWNVKSDIQVNDALTAFGRFGYRDADLFDEPPLPLPSGGSGNAQTYVSNKQFVTGFTWARSASSLLEGRFGWSRTVAGKNPAALGSASALDDYGIAGLPTDERIAGGLPTQLITGFSDLGRQATNPQWQYPGDVEPEDQLHVADRPSLAEDRLRVPAHRHGSPGRQSAVRPRFVRGTILAAVRRGKPALQPLGLHVRPAQPVRAEQHPHCQRAPADALRVSAGRLQDERLVDAQSRAALRVRDAALGEGQRPLELRSGCAPDDLRQRRLARGSLAGQAGPQQLRSAPGLRLVAHAADSHPRRLRDQLRALPPRRRRQHPADQRPAGRQRGCQPDGSDAELPDDRAGLPVGVCRSGGIQPAGLEHHLHARGLPLEPRAQLLHLGPARDRAQHGA